MRVIYMRAWVRRALCSWLVLLALVVLALVPDPPAPAPSSPYRHIPADYIRHRTANANKYIRSGCMSPPGFSQIQYSTAFWQYVSKPDDRERSVLVYAAYWDDRERAKPLVRLLVHSERELPLLRCLFWYFNKGDPVMMSVSAPEDSKTKLHVLSCSPPTRMRDSPAALSLVSSSLGCGMTRNMLGIQGIPPPPPDGGPLSTTPAPAQGLRTAVCVAWWRRGDAAVRLAEWLQLLRYFKVNRVYFYINHHQAHSNVLRVIDYYSFHAQLDGMTLDVMPYISPPNVTDVKVKTEITAVHSNPAQGDDFDEYSEVKAMEEPGEGSGEEPPPLYQDDLLPYNECIYRAMLDGIDWLAPLDLDEVILPVRHGTWADLITRESNKARYEIDEAPDELDFERWWFPQLLQTDLPSSQPATKQLTNMDNPGGSRAPGTRRDKSAAPRVVPPGRIFTYLWRASSARYDAALTGKLLRVRSLVSVSVGGARCRSACSQRAVDPDVARLHKYTWGCGGVSRGVCRLLRGAATRDAALWKWRRAQQEAALALRRVQLQAHDKSYVDDL